MQTSNEETEGRARTELRFPAFDSLARRHGLTTDWQRAKALKLRYTTVRRLRDGDRTVGEKFISHTLRWAYRLQCDPPVTFEDLFEVVDEPAA